MSTLNTKSDLNRLFPFAKKKPNIPSKASDKTDTKINKQPNEDKNNVGIQNPEQIRSDILTENNEKAKHVQEKICNIEIPTKVASEINVKVSSPKNDSLIKYKDKKSVTRKLSSNSDIILEDSKKPKENFQRWNIPFSTKFKGKEFDKKLLTMQDLIYYNPVTNPIVKELKVEQKEEDNPDDDLLPIDLLPDQKPISNNCITPCIKVGIDGKIIIDQETLTLNETGFEEKREELAKSKVIEESAFRSRSYSYKRKREHSKQWNKEETLKFYKCLMNLGTDFSMIEQYFPGRTRAQIKRKYKNEEKKNPQLVNGALTNITHYDSSFIENMFEEPKPEIVEKSETNVDVISEADVKPTPRKRRRKDCKRMSVCAYMMEEEHVLKNERKPSGKILTASHLKEEVLALQSFQKKRKTKLESELNAIEESECTNLSTDVKEKIEKSSKVRKLQDFIQEYEETIAKYEEDSNSD